MRAIAIVLAITGALAVSGIATPAPAQAGRYGCDPTDGPYPGYAGPYAYAAYYYGYPQIAEASPFTLHPRITAIGTADPDTGITMVTMAASRKSCRGCGHLGAALDDPTRNSA
jgi:hypothetical protein